jgi:hypothetical protein
LRNWNGTKKRESCGNLDTVADLLSLVASVTLVLVSVSSTEARWSPKTKVNKASAAITTVDLNSASLHRASTGEIVGMV